VKAEVMGAAGDDMAFENEKKAAPFNAILLPTHLKTMRARGRLLMAEGM
jgi:hypothetical protein